MDILAPPTDDRDQDWRNLNITRDHLERLAGEVAQNTLLDDDRMINAMATMGLYYNRYKEDDEILDQIYYAMISPLGKNYNVEYFTLNPRIELAKSIDAVAKGDVTVTYKLLLKLRNAQAAASEWVTANGDGYPLLRILHLRTVQALNGYINGWRDTWKKYLKDVIDRKTAAYKAWTTLQNAGGIYLYGDDFEGLLGVMRVFPGGAQKRDMLQNRRFGFPEFQPSAGPSSSGTDKSNEDSAEVSPESIMEEVRTLKKNSEEILQNFKALLRQVIRGDETQRQNLYDVYSRHGDLIGAGLVLLSAHGDIEAVEELVLEMQITQVNMLNDIETFAPKPPLAPTSSVSAFFKKNWLWILITILVLPVIILGIWFLIRAILMATSRPREQWSWKIVFGKQNL